MSRLRDEIKQTRPFRSTSQEAMLGLLRTADLLRRALSSVLESSGITMQQYNVLRILRGAGDAGLPTLEIGERMVEHTPGVTRLVDRLEARGWVARERCSKDRRRVWCRLTDRAIALLAELDAPMNQADDTVLAALSEREQEHLVALLDRIRASQTPRFPNPDRPLGDPP